MFPFRELPGSSCCFSGSGPTHHYLLLKTGWDGEQRIYYSVFHFDIKDDKIWIQENNTDVEVDQVLAEMGISKKELVIGFHHPSMREYSDFAIA
ncbi:MAG: XisI protein [Cyanobacteria bacterium P01_F01_bin.150]